MKGLFSFIQREIENQFEKERVRQMGIENQFEKEKVRQVGGKIKY